MEPNILEKLRQYVAKGGNPREVVEMLTDNYVGELKIQCCVMLAIYVSQFLNRNYVSTAPEQMYF